jgi:hypothetical protein
MAAKIHVGFEVGSGLPVEIPLRHLAVTGQTQESGKTTTLEALVERAGGRALAFVTKRGESAFTSGRRIQPYFRDRADWQFVTSLLDATLQEKNKFLRPWIMKICRTTRTLADVQRAVRDAMKTAKGINEGVYTQLDAYLDLLVPEIGRTKLAASLDLRAGELAVMDVSGFSTPMQMLFVQSAIDWVNDTATDTVVIVPEAWEFIPEGAGSPVKSAAVALVRKGAGIRNYIWVDSQDMAGVDKTILRGCPVWLIGVQREANEIKRSLANIPASIKRPTAAQVATLERGQFYVCYGSHAFKTYVQPAWMPADEARAIARGERIGTSAAPRHLPTAETTVNETEARALRDENAQLRRQLEQLQARLDGAESSNDQGARDVSRSGHPDKGDAGSTPVSADALYQEFKRRILAEPAVLRVLGTKKEIDVETKRETVTLDGTSWMGRVAQLIAEGFFDTPQRSAVVFREAVRRGATGIATRADEACKKLLAMGFLTREEDGFKAVDGMKVNILDR